MKALCWEGVNEVGVETVDDPRILNDRDVIVKVRLSTTCGSDLHLLGGYIPTMRSGDVLGHEFMGEVVEVGSAVRKHRVGDRVVVCSFIACGQCWYCEHELFSLCDNGNPNPAITETLWGSSIGGCFAYSHALGGYAGSHAEYIRVPYADQGAFSVPDGVSDTAALFASDAAPTGWTGADLAGITPGDTVAVWGAGGVGQMAARAAMLLGAEQVVVIDSLPERLEQVRRYIGAETLDSSEGEVLVDLRERTGGRGPDVCIEAVGMEAHGTGPLALYDQVKQQLRLESDRPTALREAIYACRKGGSLFALGVFGGLVDKFPFGAVMNKGLTVRGAQQHGHRYIPTILERIAAGDIETEHLATHLLTLDDGPKGYEMFKNKEDGCVRAVFQPGA
ncbi:MULTISPECIES: zinc-dependent alcohol dehydrogenase [unclassified Curtobacterium]|uniref:zinc-dependent alcohol dehydrogenase n=1 Tax=unclassified Curtobacterium TaxID=257496 RepID=UPI0008DD8392|nr:MULTISPECIES: zinc-dependent alcohol dehydrogenase [unclassified Curtobacterium]OIH95843.1 glutathione-dependent formaldehyde dehydrogenase [Curtobacterium sp. MCBA15_003]OII15700.1 glutathione-dependent formaldehyde dehydrogenase [Curtobacterium sp. MCBA15_009]OII33592.1 glutathione-dependent formaldehyde dehydrogenase [Curtobacterium sp. MMLR14_006]